METTATNRFFTVGFYHKKTGDWSTAKFKSDGCMPVYDNVAECIEDVNEFNDWTNCEYNPNQIAVVLEINAPKF